MRGPEPGPEPGPGLAAAGSTAAAQAAAAAAAAEPGAAAGPVPVRVPAREPRGLVPAAPPVVGTGRVEGKQAAPQGLADDGRVVPAKRENQVGRQDLSSIDQSIRRLPVKKSCLENKIGSTRELAGNRPSTKTKLLRNKHKKQSIWYP